MLTQRLRQRQMLTQNIFKNLISRTTDIISQFFLLSRIFQFTNRRVFSTEIQIFFLNELADFIIHIRFYVLIAIRMSLIKLLIFVERSLAKALSIFLHQSI